MGWIDKTATHRLPVTLNAGSVDHFDLPVEIPFNADRPPRVVEIDPEGSVVDPAVGCQYDSTGPEGGTLVFLAPGVTPANTTRRFDVYCGGEPTPEPTALIEAVEELTYQGSASFKIATPSATWIFHKGGAGFAALIDADGHDWITFRPEGGSDGKYRGIPNLVHPEGYFHPGGDQCESRLVHAGPLKVTIDSRAAGGAWATRWEIYPAFARLTVLAAANEYWFLYEGTPGGCLDETNDYCLRSGSGETAAGESWDESLTHPKWVCFGDRASQRAIYLVNHDGGDEIDSYRPMEQNMTVFGFGRKGLEKHLTRTPSRFTVGLADASDRPTVLDMIHSVTDDVSVTVGEAETPSTRETT